MPPFFATVCDCLSAGPAMLGSTPFSGNSALAEKLAQQCCAFVFADSGYHIHSMVQPRIGQAPRPRVPPFVRRREPNPCTARLIPCTCPHATLKTIHETPFQIRIPPFPGAFIPDGSARGPDVLRFSSTRGG